MTFVTKSPKMPSLRCKPFHGSPPLLQSKPNKNTTTLTRVGFRCSIRRVSMAKTQWQTPNEEEKKQRNSGIAEFYNEFSGKWGDIYGTEHFHHGFYDQDALASFEDYYLVRNKMLEEAVRFANISEDATKCPKSIIDVGCDFGGTSQYLAKKFGASCVGITLSPVQVERARTLAASQGLADKVSFQVADALKQPFPDGKFDLLWSMESAEYMPDKTKFVAELARVAAPGATIVIVTWCHRDLDPVEESLQQWEKNLLKKTCDTYYLPTWCSSNAYVKLFEALSFQDIKTEDWSTYAAQFWPALIRSALTWTDLISIVRNRHITLKEDIAYPLMIEGFKKGVIKYTIITCQKPQNIMDAE